MTVNAEYNKQGYNDVSPTAAQAPALPKVFALATWTDAAYIFLGTIGAILSGCAMPAFSVLFGEMLDSLNEGGDFQSSVNTLSIIFAIVAGINLLTGTIQVYFWSCAGERLSQRLREKYVNAILRQEIGWFDVNGAGELSTRVADLCGKVQDGTGRKIADMIQYSVQILGSYAVGIYLSWKLALVLISAFPLKAIAGYILVTSVTDATKNSLSQYAAAGGLASESLDAIRTVTALNMQPTIIAKYRAFLLTAMDMGIIKGLKVGLGNGMLFGASFLTFALGFWYGAVLVADDVSSGCSSDCYTGGTVMSVFFCILLGSSAMGQVSGCYYSIQLSNARQIGPAVASITEAAAAAQNIFEVIERTPEIDGLTEEGVVKDEPLAGSIELKNVEFSYPSRPENIICRDYNLSIQPGELVALCGPSGCGKSTIINLVLRFYDARQGQVLLDGVDIKQYNTRWLRSQIGYVGQEPVLFAGSIFDNISYGLNLTAEEMENGRDAVMERVVAAAKQANAHDFISSFPQGYETDVGSNGLSLSGGQKQRIAIARALVKRPAILLLDEATSALDAESERYVQESIDKLQQSKAQTTLVIAHRLSTIRNADRIAVISGGKVAELGNHDSLISSQGLYADLVAMQMSTAADDELMEGSFAVRRASNASEARGRAVSAASDGSTKQSANLQIGEEPIENAAAVNSRIWSLIRPHWIWLAVGILGAAAFGAVFPLWGLVLAEAQSLFYEDKPSDIRDGGEIVAIYFLVIGVGCFFAAVLEYWGLANIGERVAAKLRSDLFESFMHRQIAFFDKEENASGNLTASLADDSRIVHKATGEAVVKQIQAFFTLAIGVIIGFTASWKMSLVVIAAFPLNIIAGALQMRAIAGQQYDGTTGDGNHNALIGSAFTHMKTVCAFSMQYKISETYAELTRVVTATRMQRSFMAGVGLGVSNMAMFATYALLFWYGATLIESEEINFKELMTAIMSLMFGAFGLGSALADSGDQKNGLLAAKRIFDRIDSVNDDVIDNLSNEGITPSSPLSGCIEFKNVGFSYPSRKDIKVFKNNSFTIQPGETVAFVGPSGSGKSTVMNMLLRFYDADEGDILLDGHHIKDLNVRWLRSQIGYVGQEPVLFAGTIAENVLHGRYVSGGAGDAVVPTYEEYLATVDKSVACCSSSAVVTTHGEYAAPSAGADAVITADVEMGNLSSGVDPEVVRACELSHAAEFINTFPNGYLTDVGESSAMISGGQKQRIAIARSLVKHPSILLLDEATSALDASAERLVQESINELSTSRAHTTLVIAHRLTTIRNADKIVVVKNGEIVETGKHESLLQQNGVYAELWRKQQGGGEH